MTATELAAPAKAAPFVPSFAPSPPADVVTYEPSALPDIAVGQEVTVAVPDGWTEQQYLRALTLHEQERAGMAQERARRPGVAERIGVAGALVLAVVLGRMAWIRFDGFGTLVLVLQGALWVAAGLVVLVVWQRMSARAATIGGRKIAIRTGPHAHRALGEFGTWTASLHEAGHVVVARGVGCTVLSAHIYRDGSGVTYIRMRRDIDPVSSIAIDVAGHVGAGTSAGCGGSGWAGSDFGYMHETLQTLEPGERGRTKSRAYDKARGHINSPFSDHSGLSKKIYERGSVYF